MKFCSWFKSASWTGKHQLRAGRSDAQLNALLERGRLALQHAGSPPALLKVCLSHTYTGYPPAAPATAPCQRELLKAPLATPTQRVQLLGRHPSLPQEALVPGLRLRLQEGGHARQLLQPGLLVLLVGGPCVGLCLRLPRLVRKDGVLADGALGARAALLQPAALAASAGARLPHACMAVGPGLCRLGTAEPTQACCPVSVRDNRSSCSGGAQGTRRAPGLDAVAVVGVRAGQPGEHVALPVLVQADAAGLCCLRLSALHSSSASWALLPLCLRQLAPMPAGTGWLRHGCCAAAMAGQWLAGKPAMP